MLATRTGSPRALNKFIKIDMHCQSLFFGCDLDLMSSISAENAFGECDFAIDYESVQSDVEGDEMDETTFTGR